MSWQQSTLGDLIELENGYAFKSDEYTDDGHFLMRIANVQQGYISIQAPKFVSIPQHSNLIQFELNEGDMLMSLTGNVGRVGLIEAHHLPAALNQRVARVKIKNLGKIDKGYLFSFFNTDDTRAKIENLANGAAQLNVSTKDVKSLTIPLPPLAQQQRIAAILDKAADIKAKREQAIAKLDELAQSTFVEMFGDPRNNERKFPLSKIGELLSDFRGGAALKPEDFVEAGFPILHKGAIKQNGNVIIDEGKKTFATHEYAASKSANIINREYLAVTLRDLVPTGPSIGLVASMEDGAYDEYLLAQGAYGFKINNAKLNAEYFVQLSNMPNFRHVLRQFAVGSTQIHIRTPVYQDISIPVPPISLQNEFGELMRKQRLVRKVVVNCLEKYSNLINSLQHQAFTTGFNA